MKGVPGRCLAVFLSSLITLPPSALAQVVEIVAPSRGVSAVPSGAGISTLSAGGLSLSAGSLSAGSGVLAGLSPVSRAAAPSALLRPANAGGALTPSQAGVSLRSAPATAAAPMSAALPASPEAPVLSALEASPRSAAMVEDGRPIVTRWKGMNLGRRIFGEARRRGFAFRAPADTVPDASAGKTPAPAARLERAGEQVQGESAGVPAPAAAPAGSIGRSPLNFIRTLVVTQIGYEAFLAAFPALTEKAFGAFTVGSYLTMLSFLVEPFGGLLAPRLIKKIGLRRTYMFASGGLVASYFTMGLLLTAGAASLPMMVGFFALNGFLAGISSTAEMIIPREFIGPDNAKLDQYWARRQIPIEVVSTSVPILISLAIPYIGLFTAILAYPIAAAIALTAQFRVLAHLKEIEARAPQALEAAAGGPPPHSLRSIVSSVWHNPTLRAAFLAYTAFYLTNALIYYVLGPGFGLMIAGGNAELSTIYSGWIFGLYSFGGMLAGFAILYQQRLRERIGLDQAQTDESQRLAMIHWLRLGTLALPILASLAYPILIPFAAGLTVQALLMIGFGLAQVNSVNTTKGYFLTKIPEADVEKAMSFFNAASLAIVALVVIPTNLLFDNVAFLGTFFGLSGANSLALAFYGVAVVIPFFMLLTWWLTTKVAAASALERSSAAPSAAKP